MTSMQVRQLFWALIVFSGIMANAYADTIDNPCAGSSALLDIVDRPSNADSVCVVPFKQAVLEAGYQYQQLTHSAGRAQNLPEAELRIGLPANNEVNIFLPNFIYPSRQTNSGYAATVLGIKHSLGYTKKWQGAMEGLFTLPSGNAAYGSSGAGGTFNLIAAYNFNAKFNLTFMLGVSTQTQSSHDGGQRFNSINPDVVLTYAPNDNFNLYGEIYGQSKTAPGMGSGFDVDGGVLYLLFPNFEIDAEIGQRISGNLGGFNHYIGTGLAMMF